MVEYTHRKKNGGKFMKTLIIGGVAGGASCAARLRRLDEKAEIVILERGEFISFANCGLPYYIGGEITEKSNLTLQTPESFKARFNIEVRTFSEAVAIDTENKIVTVKDLKTGEEYAERYDSLVLSPGASPIRPRIDGIDSDRVFTLRNIPDTMKIKQYIDEKHPKSAVVVGGGYIGVEMAENLANAGLDVTIVELSDHLIAPLDFDMAADVHRYIKSKGIRLALGNGVVAIQESDNGLTVELNRGVIDTDMVLLSVGVRPDTAFIKSAEIETNERGSIIVHEKMQTSAPDVYAVGDAVAVKNFVTGEPSFIPLAGPANKQGRIAADNICGIPSEYKGTQGSSVLMRFEMANGSLVTSGNYERYYTVGGVRYHHLIDPETKMPASKWASVSVLTEDSALADALSTALFMLDYEEATALLGRIGSVEALWVKEDGECYFTAGFPRN
jgi:NADPH-dependent 2,4-dienoyl-CoA reductase/sulfur reductase-like enzyme